MADRTEHSPAVQLSMCQGWKDLVNQALEANYFAPLRDHEQLVASLAWEDGCSSWDFALQLARSRTDSLASVVEFARRSEGEGSVP